MIPQSYITAWRKQAPWQENYQVEQDLIIQRALIDLFKDDFIRERLAFRGGTALHKLFLSPAARYSEDIDLVQVKAEPFGPSHCYAEDLNQVDLHKKALSSRQCFY